jgi:soluble lytic murein transglycosylase
VISRITTFLILSTGLLFAEPAESPFFESVGETRVLKVDLMSESDPARLDAIVKKLRKELGKTKSGARRDEIEVALGVISIKAGKHEEAIEFFKEVGAESLLYDASLYFRGQAYRLLGERFTAEKPAKGLVSCKKGQEFLKTLADHPAGPFTEPGNNELEGVRLCLARGLVDKGLLDEAQPFILSILQSDRKLNDADRETLLLGLVRLLKKEKRSEEAAALVAEELKDHPTFQKLAAERVEDTSSKNESDAKKKSKTSIPPFKTRTPDEEVLLTKINKLQAAGRIKDELKLIRKIYDEFPGSSAAQKCEAKLRAATEIAAKQKSFPGYFVDDSKSLPPEPMYSVGKTLWQKDLDDEAYELLEHMVSEYPRHPKSGDALFILGRIDENRGNWKKARESFTKLVTQYSGSNFFDTAHFKLGFLSYLMKEESDALQWLEYDRTQNRSTYLQARAIYWISKIYEHQKKNKEREEYRDEIRRVAPLSFYAVLAERIPTFTGDASSYRPPQDFWNSYRIQRARALLGAGLLGFARQVLGRVDLDLEPQLSTEVGILYGASRQHVSSFQVAYSLVESGKNKTLPIIISKLLFPLEYEGVIRQESESNQMDPMLVFSLIKQESAYSESAESRTGALGLMQLMPATALQVAQQAAAPKPSVDDLLKSETNVRLGIRYLKSMIERYKGNAVYALAAYNAGPERVDLWVKQWGDSLPMEEFVEMMPFEETRNYVKSILRNFAFYKFLLEAKTVDLQQLTKLNFAVPATSADKL